MTSMAARRTSRGGTRGGRRDQVLRSPVAPSSHGGGTPADAASARHDRSADYAAHDRADPDVGAASITLSTRQTSRSRRVPRALSGSPRRPDGRATARNRCAIAQAGAAGSRHRRAERAARIHARRATTHSRSPRSCGAWPMRFRCYRCGQSWPDHPVTRVACPTCRAAPGAWCHRPSGHRAMDLHVDREHAALAMGVLQTCRPSGTDRQFALDLHDAAASR